MAVNRRFWREAVAIHLASEFYDVDGFRQGRCTLSPIERRELGEVDGQRLLHLHCHFGLDTLSLARLGADCTGLDFAPEAIAAAQQLGAETGLPASFVAADVYDAADHLPGGFDIVFASWGVWNWLPDLPRWARVVAGMLRPGGRFYLVDAHPAVHWFDDAAGAEAPLTMTYDFRGDGEAEFYDEPGSYADPAAKMQNTGEYFWRRGLGDFVNAVAAAGLRLEFLHEHDAICWQALPQLQRSTDGLWRLPASWPGVPLSFSFAAYK